MKKLFISTVMAVIAAATVMAEGAAPTLDLKFDTPQEITVGTTKVVFDGKIQDGMMFFGPKLYSMPAAGLAGEKGTILAKLTWNPIIRNSKVPGVWSRFARKAVCLFRFIPLSIDIAHLLLPTRAKTSMFPTGNRSKTEKCFMPQSHGTVIVCGAT